MESNNPPDKASTVSTTENPFRFLDLPGGKSLTHLSYPKLTPLTLFHRNPQQYLQLLPHLRCPRPSTQGLHQLDENEPFHSRRIQPLWEAADDEYRAVLRAAVVELAAQCWSL